MTPPHTLNVEYEELMARAAELEAPVPGRPPENPRPPSELPLATKAARQLAMSADNMRIYLGAGIDREWRRLAESLRNAALAYKQFDEDTAEALTTDTDVSAVSAGHADEDPDVVTLTETQALKPEPVPYYSVRQAAHDICQPDQGAAFDEFAEAWTEHEEALLEARNRFRPFQAWEGEATRAVEASFEGQRVWLFQMADLCHKMAIQAHDVAAAQRWALRHHPTAAELKKVDDYWTAAQNDRWWPDIKRDLEQRYRRMQQESEEVLDEYGKRAASPLRPINPPKPPPAHSIDPPLPWYPDPDHPTDHPTGMPIGLPPGMPPTPDTSALTDAFDDTGALADAVVPGLSTTGSGLRPASFGGAASSLQPPTVPDSASAGSAAGRPPGPPGQWGGAAGRGGMGAAPMGAPGAGQGQKGAQRKRPQQEDPAVYEEDRSWTGGVIGNRRRNDPPTVPPAVKEPPPL